MTGVGKRMERACQRQRQSTGNQQGIAKQTLSGVARRGRALRVELSAKEPQPRSHRDQESELRAGVPLAGPEVLGRQPRVLPQRGNRLPALDCDRRGSPKGAPERTAPLLEQLLVVSALSPLHLLRYLCHLVPELRHLVLQADEACQVAFELFRDGGDPRLNRGDPLAHGRWGPGNRWVCCGRAPGVLQLRHFGRPRLVFPTPRSEDLVRCRQALLHAAHVPIQIEQVAVGGQALARLGGDTLQSGHGALIGGERLRNPVELGVFAHAVFDARQRR